MKFSPNERRVRLNQRVQRYRKTPAGRAMERAKKRRKRQERVAAGLPYHKPEKKARHNRNARARNKLWLLELKLANPCACGEADPVALDLHHRNPAEKEFNMVKAKEVGFARLQRETAKCEVICSNCHRRGHAGRPRKEHARFFLITR